jgi:DNA topoisomerase-1
MLSKNELNIIKFVMVAMPPKYYKKKSTPSVLSKNTSATFLIIVESPSKCPKIEHFLGEDYCCIASKGHIRSIDGLKSIDTKNSFEPTFSIIDEKKDHVEAMRKIISNFQKQNIILASDDDREGEAIAWHICQIFDLPVETTKRIIFHEVTKQAIIDAVQKPIIINMNLVRAQHARQVLDIIVGYKISPYLWKYLYNNKSNSLSAGRCQTPALRLVYDNEKEKETCGTETKHQVKGIFFSKAIEFILNHEFDNDADVLEFMEKTKQHQHMLKIGEEKPSTKSPPKPFHTSRLLQVASNSLHMSPKTTMELCQKLYQAGYITYMRTESSQYSSVFLEQQAKKYILKEYVKSEYLGNFDAISLKDSNNPHEAIRVTQIEIRAIPQGDDPKMATLYKLIWRNTLESCMSEAKFKTRQIKISAPLEYYYSHTIEIPLFYGWKIVSEKPDETGSQNTGRGLVTFFQSILDSKKPCPFQTITSTVVVRNKHQHYTEASLINKLEDLGIGRPSTFASIVETIQDRGYVKKTDIEGTKLQCKEYQLTNQGLDENTTERVFGNEKNKLLIQPIGTLTLEFLLQYYQSLFSYEYTKNMEEQLDTVSSGQIKEWSTLCKSCYNEIKTLSKPIQAVAKQSYIVEDGYEYIFEKYGPAIKHTLEDGTIEYLPAKKEMQVDLDKLKNKEYRLDELLEIKSACLGKYENEDIYVKTGRYGPYIEWGDKRESIKTLVTQDHSLESVTLQEIHEFLDEKKTTNVKTSLRVLNDVMSIKKGKFGAYVYYKRPDMKKPEFLNIKTFKEGFLTCDSTTLVNWLCQKYNLPNPL